jgi:predicted phage terminase large subunit-like protein
MANALRLDDVEFGDGSVDPDDFIRADCRDSLSYFIEAAWHIVEPAMPYAHNWHIDFLARHLEGITDKERTVDGDLYNRLLINIPPGCMKSLLVNVFWPCWEWGPKKMPHMRYICASHSQDLAIRDGLKMRRLVESEWFQNLWPHVKLTGDQNAKTKFETTATGFRQATAAGSITGARADRVIIDDPLSVQDAMSDQIKQTTNTWFQEAVPTRLSSPKESAIIVIMQRLAEDDTSGIILDKYSDEWDHICLPMRFDPSRALPSKLGEVDLREFEGELLFPDRFPEEVVDRDERIMGPYATAGQFQQSPEPRGGGIIPRAEWRLWEQDHFPQFDFILASADLAYTEKKENDPSALSVWGVFSGGEQKAQLGHYTNRVEESRAIMERKYTQEHPKIMLIHAWAEHLEFHALMQKIQETCAKYQVEQLLVENKGPGLTLGQEMRRVYGTADFGLQIIDPGNLDKVARAYSVQGLFYDGCIYAPDRTFADLMINQCAVFPKGKNDDLVDTMTQALNWLRKNGMLQRGAEWTEALDEGRKHLGKPPPSLYPV